MSTSSSPFSLSFFFTDPATTEIYTLSLHDALPSSECQRDGRAQIGGDGRGRRRETGFGCLAGRLGRKRLPRDRRGRSEEHTSELQSHSDLVCRLLLEKKKKKKKRIRNMKQNRKIKI